MIWLMLVLRFAAARRNHAAISGGIEILSLSARSAAGFAFMPRILLQINNPCQYV
jgi:hypothetical protein